MATRKIQVTHEDITSGRPGDCIGCPVAIAATRVFNRECLVDFDSILVSSTPWDDRMTFRLPTNVRRRIRRFDMTAQMRPFTFELEG